MAEKDDPLKKFAEDAAKLREAAMQEPGKAKTGEELVRETKPSPDFEAERQARKAERKQIRSNLTKLFGDNPTPKKQAANFFDDLKTKKDTERKQFEESAREYARTHPEARKQFQQIRAQLQKPAQTKSNILELPKTTVKSTAEQLQELQLKNLKRQQQRESSSIFRLPDIPKDTATSIVIASLVATFFILAGIGTKFSQLWGYAFNAPITSIGNNQQNQDISTLDTTASNLQTLESNTGGGQSGDEAWGIPDIYHMIYDAGDAGVTLDEERTA